MEDSEEHLGRFIRFHWSKVHEWLKHGLVQVVYLTGNWGDCPVPVPLYLPLRSTAGCCAPDSMACSWFVFYLPALQEDYSAGVRHYDREEYELAIELLERALQGYYSEDEDCQLMCEGPQRFEEHEHLDYKAGLYEAIAGEIFLHFYSSHPWP